MTNTNLSKLNAKDKMLIAKAVADIATSIYKDNNNFILNQVIANGKHDSKYGQFTNRHNEAKTIQEVLNSKKANLEKLQAEITQLEALEDKSAIYTEASNTLVSKHYAEADNIAKELLQDLYETMDYNKLSKSASKVPSKNK